MSNKLDDLRKAAADANRAFYVEQDEIRRKEHAALVGKCFGYRNSYSMPEKPSDYWWLYIKVVDITDNGYLKTKSFQRDKNGDFSFSQEERMRLSEDYKEISTDAYAHALAGFLSDLEEAAHD